MIDFIYNANAGNGNGAKVMKKIRKILDKLNVPYRDFATKCKGDGKKIAEELSEKGSSTIVAVGGDGTVHEVLNGINLDTVKLGIVPAGSGNDFASFCRIPKNVKKALSLILENNPKPTDCLDCCGIKALNHVSTGIDVEVVDRCYKSSFFKGKLQYFVSLIISLCKFRYYHVESSDEKNLNENVLVAVLANGREFGGGIKICPTAVVDDGFMDFLYITKIPLIRSPLIFIKLLCGKIHTEKITHLTKEKHVALKLQEGTLLNIDGELYKDLSFDAKVLQGKLSLLRP
ncbi:MAG: diacylglycerol/lipid kinase family protein [Christensenellaceae bacterium]